MPRVKLQRRCSRVTVKLLVRHQTSAFYFYHQSFLYHFPTYELVIHSGFLFRYRHRVPIIKPSFFKARKLQSVGFKPKGSVAQVTTAVNLARLLLRHYLPMVQDSAMKAATAFGGAIQCHRMALHAISKSLFHLLPFGRWSPVPVTRREQSLPFAPN